jgi:hypothetical protein
MDTLDLFIPVTPKEKWHPNFAHQIEFPNEWNRAVLNKWAKGFVDRDGKFVQEFQTSFNSCFWELYLNAVLNERGLSIDFSFKRPDFVITGPKEFAMEAVIASHANGGLPENEASLQNYPEDLNELNRQAILRLSNALHSKHKKYLTEYSAMSHVRSKPFVIALAPFDRPFFNLSCQRAIEALLYNYYLDESEWIHLGLETSPPKKFISSVKKDNGAEIELGLFQGKLMPEISAVLFSTCATWGKVRAMCADPNPSIYFKALRFSPNGPEPTIVSASKADYRESLLDGLRIYHNPNANHPLDPAIFRSPEIMQSYFSMENEDWIYEECEGQLLFRFVMTLECE